MRLSDYETIGLLFPNYPLALFGSGFIFFWTPEA